MLMDRIYCRSFLDMPYLEQVQLIEKIRAIRSSALNSAKISANRITKSAIKNISKNAKKGGKRKMLKDPTKAAHEALSKLSSEQIALLAEKLQNIGD